VVLPPAWSEKALYGLSVSGWNIMGFVEDPNGIFGGSSNTLAPILVAKTIIGTSSTIKEAFLSFELPEIMANAQRINLTGINPLQVYQPPQLYQAPSPYSELLNYVIGRSDTPFITYANLPQTWITIQEQKMIPLDVNMSVSFNYLDDYYAGSSIGLISISSLGTSYYTPIPTNILSSGLVSMYYSISFNAITGTPILSLNIYPEDPNVGGTPFNNTVYISSINVAPDPTLGKLFADGVSPSILTYTVSAQFQSVPQIPSDIPILIMAPGLLFMSRQGYTWSGIMVVGAVDYVYLDSAISNYTEYQTGGTSTISFAQNIRSEGLLESIINRLILDAQAVIVLPGTPACDVIVAGAGVCYNLTSAPGSAIIVPEAYSSTDEIYILDLNGTIQQIIAYYYDPVAKTMLNQTVCDGNCLDLQGLSPCKVIAVSMTNTSLSPSNRLAAIQVIYQAQGGGGAGGGIGEIVPPPPGNITLPEHGYISTPSLTTPKGLMTLALFIVFYVYYNQKMSHAQALVVSTALTGVLSIIIWGPTYLTAILIIFGVGLALYYVLGK